MAVSIPRKDREHYHARFCQICGNILGWKSQSYRHSLWPEGHALWVCETCVAEAACCRICGMPLREAGTEGLCVTCAQTIPRCLACGDAITGQFVEFGGQGPYCETCSQERIRCDVCGSPLDEAHQVLTDDRRICSGCHSTAIYDQVSAIPVYEQVRQILLRQLGLSLNVPTGLILVGRDQLSEIFSQMGFSVGDVTQTLGIYARRGRKRGIYAQSGLPRLLLMQVIAHEWGHAWQMENAPLLKDPLIKEGFAEWVAYKVLQTIDSKPAMARMLQRTDVYGLGLQQSLAVEEKAGEQAVLRWCCGAPR